MTVEELGVKIEWLTAGFKKKADETKRIFKSVSSSVDDVKGHVSDLKKAFSSGWKNEDALKMTKAYKSVQDQITKTADKLEYLKAKQSRMGDGLEWTSEAKKLQKEYDNLAKSVQKWREQQSKLNSTSQAYKEIEEKIGMASDRMKFLRLESTKLKESGGAYRFKESFLSLEHQIKNTESALNAYKARADQLASDGQAYEQPRKFSERLREMGDRIKSSTNRIKSLIPHFPRLGQRVQAAGSSIRNFIKSAVGIGSLIMLFNRLRSSVKEGFGNLSLYSTQTASDLARLKGSLTQVKDSLAVAFAPILTVIAPLIQTFVNYITTACNALAMFFGALTGQKTVTIAKSGLGDVAAGASGAADATSAANSAAQEYQRTLMGFDQINKLDDQSGSSGSGAGAGGVGGAAGFQTAEVENVYSSWAEKIKDAWDKADFYEVGRAAGDKIKKALDEISWDKVKAVGEKAAKSIATGLNGFLETPGLFNTVGTTVAEALNTVFGTANTFAKEFHWTSLGKAVSDSINSFFETFNFKLAAETISNWGKGILDSAIAAVEGVKWKQVGKKAAEFLANIEWGDLLSKGFELAGAALGGIASAIAGFFEDAVSSVKDYFTGKIEDAGGDIVQGIWNGVTDAISGAYTWIKEHIFQPFIDGFKKVFGIASPSKEMKPLGENIIEGLKNGLVAKFTDIVSWFTDLPGKIKKAVGDIVMDVKAKFTEFKDDIKNKLIDFKANLTDKKDAIKKKLLDFKANLTEKKDAINKKLLDFKANLTDKKDAIKKKLLDFKANLTDKQKGKGFSSTLSHMIANFTGKKDSIKDKTIGSFEANITKANWKAGNKLIVPSGMTIETKAGGGLFANGKWKPITAAASGGSFSTGQMFVAREAGPELVGRIGNHTAVMNNNQIVSSVAAGVADAVASVLGSGNQTTVVLEGDAKGLFRVVKREATNYTNATGLAAFPV